ncbi:hypothetical protein ACMGD3_23900 [Lysinibacillus sphaericus]|uniref:hypothetical protein n=1 Tax=Lysinibacillus sphaericus TaxID=1421 RepID=UPI003F7AB775
MEIIGGFLFVTIKFKKENQNSFQATVFTAKIKKELKNLGIKARFLQLLKNKKSAIRR